MPSNVYYLHVKERIYRRYRPNWEFYRLLLRDTFPGTRRAHSSTWQYLLGCRSPVSAVHLLRNIAQDFLSFRKAECSVSLHLYVCSLPTYKCIRRIHNILFKRCRLLFVLSPSLRMEYLFLPRIRLRKAENPACPPFTSLFPTSLVTFI